MRRSLFCKHLFALMLLFVSTGLLAQYHVPSKYPTINAAIAAAPAGSCIYIAAGTYNEHVVVNKRLTLIGAGNTTIIKPTTDGPALSITAGGSSWYSRLAIKYLQTSGATGGDPNIGSGIAISGPAVQGHLTFDHVTSKTNTGHGLSISSTSAICDLYFQDCDFSYNGNSGFVVNETCYGIDWLLIYGGHFDGNGTLSVIQGDGLEIFAANASRNCYRLIDDVYIKGTTFNNNKSKGVYVERLNDATIENVVLTGNGTTSTFFPNAIDINLKYNDFKNIVVKNAIVKNNGGVTGTGIYVKARNDGAIYSVNPASLKYITIKGGKITGSKLGIVMKYNICYPKVACVSIYDNLSAGLLNEIDGLPIINAESNWWGSYKGPFNSATNRYGLGNSISDRVDYKPFATSASFNSCGCYVVNNNDDDEYDHDCRDNHCNDNHKSHYDCDRDDDDDDCDNRNNRSLAEPTQVEEIVDGAFAPEKFTPSTFKASNYPNPFSKSTTIQYALPLDSRVTLKVYDVAGKEVATLVTGDKKAGIHLVEFAVPGAVGGIFYYRLTAVSSEKTYTQTGKMIAVK